MIPLKFMSRTGSALITLSQLDQSEGGGGSYHVLIADGLQGVVSLGSLTTKHDAVIAIQHSVGHVTGLSASWPGFLGHALQHLKRNNKTLY